MEDHSRPKNTHIKVIIIFFNEFQQNLKGALFLIVIENPVEERHSLGGLAVANGYHISKVDKMSTNGISQVGFYAGGKFCLTMHSNLPEHKSHFTGDIHSHDAVCKLKW